MDINLNAIFNNIVRIGKISSVDSGTNSARVIFADKQDENGNPLISGALKILNDQSVSASDNVLCLFLPNGKGDGFILGRYS